MIAEVKRIMPGFIQVEYDLNYHGGDYSGVGRFVYLPEEGLTDDNIGQRFQEVTGYGPEHIITYSDELYTEDGDLWDESDV